MAEQDLIALIMTSPYFYLMVVTGIIGFVIIKIYNKPRRPETQAFYGDKVRKKVTKEKINNRSNVWGHKLNFDIYKGFYKIGKAVKVEDILRNNPHTNHTYHNFTFRPFGLTAWLKSLIGRYENLIIDPKAVSIDYDRKKVIISNDAYIIETSGVWTLATKKDVQLITDWNAQLELDNSLGFQQDMLRRLASHDTGTSIKANILTHESDLEEQGRRNRISSWVKG